MSGEEFDETVAIVRIAKTTSILTGEPVFDVLTYNANGEWLGCVGASTTLEGAREWAKRSCDVFGARFEEFN